MPDIQHRLAIKADPSRIYDAITTPSGLNAWWTKDCEGSPEVGAPYRFYFSDDFDWKAEVVEVEPGRVIAWRFTDAEPDWTGTTLRLELQEESDQTWLSFLHSDWASDNEHFCHSSFCWAMYLRLLRRFVEEGTTVAYESRGES